MDDRLDAIFSAMQQTEMREWVGGSDPAFVGGLNFAVLQENLQMRPDLHIFDFGCGIGRAAAPLAAFLTAGQIIGNDMVPAQIRFCQTEISSRFNNAKFHCVHAQNRHYDHLVTELPTISEAEFFAAHCQAFDLTVAFSVFTHFDPGMAAHYLRALWEVTKPGGHLFLTWFLDHPANPADHRLDGGGFRDVYGELGLALFSPVLVQTLAHEAGLSVERLTFGWWRDGIVHAIKGQNYQDVVILRR